MKAIARTKKQPVVIYHKNCADGFGAAWAMRRYYLLVDNGPNPIFWAAGHGDSPPLEAAKDAVVFLVDYCYRKYDMQDLIAVADRVVVLDHHKTAKETLDELEHIEVGDKFDFLTVEDEKWELAVCFDLERSGAGITWDFMFPRDIRPALITRIEDRDLWKFEWPGTKEIQAAVFSHPYEFAEWDLLMNEKLQALYDEGVGILRKQRKSILEMIQAATQRMEIGGHDVPVINVPYMWGSDACEILSEGEPFAAYYWDSDGWRNFGLRSREQGLDVSEIAKQYGGGGHEHASGFRVPHVTKGPGR